ncbi:MAG: flagellar protein FlaG [Candidatus Nitrohelix vancouverensis]|uniref:Flagellar protein FlaG n=1 Tax=Candidatus Nitrohelix vancouverensis TaxID=2705534 RepID=A0A7T0C1B4_9BACT|nr:MAG: flagellar protein FlaG [Candidatus Nitrohelix vancouverensis]
MDIEVTKTTGNAPVEAPRLSSSTAKPAPAKAPAVNVQTSEVEDSVSLSKEAKNALTQSEVNRAGKQGSKEAVNTESGSSNTPSSVERKLSVTDDNQVVLKIIDGKTQKLVRQIPAEEVVRLKDAMRNFIDRL